MAVTTDVEVWRDGVGLDITLACAKFHTVINSESSPPESRSSDKDDVDIVGRIPRAGKG